MKAPARSETIVVTVRHPEHANETVVFGAGQVRTIDLDLGRGFDITKSGPRQYGTVIGWAASHYAAVSDLDPADAARLYVEAQVRDVLVEVGRYESWPASDGAWNVYDRAEQKAVAGGFSRDAADLEASRLETARDIEAEIRREAVPDAC